MRILIWIGLLIAVVATLSGQSGKSAQAPARSATLPSDIQPDSLNRLPVVKREQMDENGKKAYDLNAGGPGKIAQPTGPGAIALYSPGASEPLRRLNNYLRRDGNIMGNAITELAILVAAREGDSQYIWSAHEPAALKAGVAQPVIEAFVNQYLMASNSQLRVALHWFSKILTYISPFLGPGNALVLGLLIVAPDIKETAAGLSFILSGCVFGRCWVGFRHAGHPSI